MKKTQGVILDPHTVIALFHPIFRNDEKVLEIFTSRLKPLINLELLVRP